MWNSSSRWLLAIIAFQFFFLAAAPAADEGPIEASATTSDTTALKAQILHSAEWKRAIFELGHWLDQQQIYSASQVATIKADFNARVAKMSPQELRYLLDDLHAKFQVMDTAEAKDARAWLGQYLAVLSDSEKARLLRDVPDITKMTAGELQATIQEIERKRTSLAQRQGDYENARQQVLASQQSSIAATQKAVASSRRGGGVPYSPYRSGGNNSTQTPFSDVHIGSRGISASIFGASVSF